MIIIRDRRSPHASAEVAETDLQVQITADTKDDGYLEDYAEEFTDGLADAMERIERNIELSKYGVFK